MHSVIVGGDGRIELVNAQTEAMFGYLKDNPDYTAMISDRHFERVRGYVADAREKGATIVEINPAGETFEQQEHRRQGGGDPSGSEHRAAVFLRAAARQDGGGQVALAHRAHAVFNSAQHFGAQAGRKHRFCSHEQGADDQARRQIAQHRAQTETAE